MILTLGESQGVILEDLRTIGNKLSYMNEKLDMAEEDSVVIREKLTKSAQDYVKLQNQMDEYIKSRVISEHKKYGGKNER